MVKRLKPILPSIISPEQTRIIRGRQILDGIFTAQESIHSLHTLNAKGMLIKLDLAKAYDRLYWTYLQNILQAYGFDQRWIQWILSFISTPNFSILINGFPSDPFSASRGLRQ